MTIDEAVISVLSSLEGKLVDAGYITAANDLALRNNVEAALRAALAPAGAAALPAQVAPLLTNVDNYLTNIVDLLKLEANAGSAVESHCAVFLGAGTHFPEPGYPPPNGSPARRPYPPAERPPVGTTLAKELATQCAFAANFPTEFDGDWMRVSTWHERENGRNGAVGLEGRIKTAVEVGKRGSQMLDEIASWPCRAFYTTNFDTHLEKALLAKHEEIFVWIYHPQAFQNRPFDLRTNWWRMARGLPDGAQPSFEPWAPAIQPNLTGEALPEPPPDKVAVFKLHGDVRVRGSVVITDDDYIKFLRRIAKFELPRRLLLPLSSTILFIGYSLRDFNMRYVLSMLREERDKGWDGPPMSYSVDLRPDLILKATWQERDRIIKFVEHNLWDIVPEISRRMQL